MSLKLAVTRDQLSEKDAYDQAFAYFTTMFRQMLEAGYEAAEASMASLDPSSLAGDYPEQLAVFGNELAAVEPVPEPDSMLLISSAIFMVILARYSRDLARRQKNVRQSE